MKDKLINGLNTGKKRRGAPVLLAVLLCAALAGGLMACTADAGTRAADKKIGYIQNFDTATDRFEFDEIEWITLDDTDRIKELNLNPDDDMPNGFYINNPTSDTKSYTVTDETEYQIIDWNENGMAATVDLNGFVAHINAYEDYSPPFWIVMDHNVVISIVEQYIP